MKKARKMTSVIIAAAMLCCCSVSAGAHGCHGAERTVKQTYCKARFVDENNDGICDNCGKLCAFVDKDGDGICDNCHFTDEDRDGVCDSRKLCSNGSGVCDNRSGCAGAKKNSGCGRGKCRR